MFLFSPRVACVQVFGLRAMATVAYCSSRERIWIGLMGSDGSHSPSSPNGALPGRSSSPPSYRPNPIPKGVAPTIPTGPEYDLTADDDGEVQRAPRPSRAEDGTLVFEGRWKGVFTPNVTPEEMFKGGAFGGAFFWYVPVPRRIPVALATAQHNA